MSTATLDAGRLSRIWGAPVGKKALMAVTGIVWFGFVLGHMIGNLQIYAGPAKINAYAEFLHHNVALLWAVRTIVGGSLLVHVILAVQLQFVKNAARPVPYQMRANLGSTVSSRSMIFGGLALALFILYHLAHLTLGVAHAPFQDLKPFENMVAGFANPAIAGVYLAAMVALALHLHHSAYSVFQTLGVSHPRYTPWFKRLALGYALVVFVGNCSIPLSVLLGFVK